MTATESTHVIGAQAFLIRSANDGTARRVLDRTTALWHAELASIAERVFDAHCPADRRWRVPRLELSLGRIAEEDYDSQLPRRFREALEAELRRLASVTPDPGVAAGPAGGWLEVLEHVLLHGFLPWWAQVGEGFSPADELTRGLHRDAGLIAALARKIGRHRRVRARLVRWLDDPALARLIRALAPADADFILGYAEDLQARQEEEHFVPATNAEFRQAKWETILAHLLADRGSRFNAKAFLRATLRDLAGHFRIAYADLLRELVHSARRVGRAWREASLPQLLEELWSEDVLAAEIEPAQLLQELAQPTASGHAAPASAADWAAWKRFTRAERVELGLSLLERDGPEPLTDFLRRIPEAATRAEVTALVEELRRARALKPAIDAFWSMIVRGDPAPSRVDSPELLEWHRLSPDVRGAVARTGQDRRASAATAAEWARRVSSVTDAAGAGRETTVAGSDRTDREDAPADPFAASVAEARATADEAVLPAFRELLLRGGISPAVWAGAWRVFESSGAPRPSPLAWLELVLVRYAEILPPLLRQWAKASPVAVALPAHFADEPLESIVATLEPEHAVEIGEFVRTARSGEPPLAGVDACGEAFRRTVWNVVFDYLLSDRGSVFNQRSFLEHSVDRIATREGVKTQALLDYLLAAATGAGRHALFRDLRAIAEARQSRDARGAAAADLPTTDADAASALASGAVPLAMLRGSRVLALRAFRLLLSGPVALPAGQERAVLGALCDALDDPAVRPLIAQVLLTVSELSSATLTRLLAAGFAPALGAVVFRGEPDRFDQWQSAIAACIANPALHRFVGDATGFRARAWRALLVDWRRRGGRPIRDVHRWLAQWLAAERGLTLSPEPTPGGTASASTKGVSREIATEGEPAAPPTTDEPIAIANAGLVLLAPFFPELHRRAGLLDGTQFRDFAATQTAVHLLQYLATGGQRNQEYTLVLNKLLCGVDPASPVVAQVELGPELVGPAIALLENVARQWPRGAKVSIDGLRSSYLVRPGRLKRIEKQAWSLKVETRGWDILLPELPWSFGRVQAPWMTGPLTVDWI